MEQIIILALFSALGLAVVTLILNFDRWYEPKLGYPYEPRSYLYDGVERRFLGHLVQAVGHNFIIFGKVRIADVLKVKSSESEGKRRIAQERIAKDHIDFVLCDKVTTRIICAVELYDPHNHKTLQIKRARALDKIFKAAGVPLARFPRAERYKTLEIESSLSQVFENLGLRVGSKRFVSNRNQNRA